MSGAAGGKPPGSYEFCSIVENGRLCGASFMAWDGDERNCEGYPAHRTDHQGREVRPPLSAPAVQPRFSGAVTVRLSDVRPERVTWLWRGRIPLGKLTLLDGDPDLGKSALTLDLAARVSTGAPMPLDSISELGTPAGVVLLSAEDGLADTIRPRLDAAGADTTRISALRFVLDGGSPRLPTLADLDQIRDAATEVAARLIAIDPFTAYLPDEVNGHRDQAVRRVLAPLGQLAEELGAAILLIRHLNKAEGGRAVYRGGGSIGIIAAARSGLAVAKDPDDEKRRILVPSKSNLSARVSALTYRLEAVGAAGDVVRVVWEGESSYTAEDLLQEVSAQVGQTATDRAFVWLLDILGKGPRSAKAIETAGAQQGFSRPVLRHARERLRIRPRQSRDGWYWELAADEQGSLLRSAGGPAGDPDDLMTSPGQQVIRSSGSPASDAVGPGRRSTNGQDRPS